MLCICAASAAAAPFHLRAVRVTAPVGLLGVGEHPVVTLLPQRGLPRGSYYYAVAVLVHYPRGLGEVSPPPCAISSDMGLTQYGRPQAGRALGLTLLPAGGDAGSWCANATYDGAVYAVPHPPPCDAYYPCYGRGSCGGSPSEFCGVIANPGPYSYPGGLPRPIDASARIVGRFQLRVGGALGTGSGIEPAVGAQLLAIARQEALRRGGDPHPYDIEAVSSTYERVARLQDGTAGPSFASLPVYFIAMRGRFSCGRCSGPPGAVFGKSGVITLTRSVAGDGPTGFGFGSPYPDMELLGDPVRLG